MSNVVSRRSAILSLRCLHLQLLASLWICMLSGCGSGIVSGKISQLVPVYIQLTLSPSLATAGKPVSIRAAVTALGSTPTGEVQFYDNDIALAHCSLNDHGEALFSVTAISAGAHSFSAHYSGSGNYQAGNSAAVAVTVSGAPLVEKTTIHIEVNPTSALTGQQISITGTVESMLTVATSTVSVYDGDLLIGATVLDSQGHFTFLQTMQMPGIHQIRAKYEGDSYHGPSSSLPVALSIADTSVVTSITLAGNPTPAKAGEPVALVAVINSLVGVVPGEIHFYDGALELGTQPIAPNGVATLNPKFLTGIHSITATFQGSIRFQASRSLPLILKVSAGGSGEQSFQADEFVNSIGVNTHLSYTDTPYFSRWPDVLLKLRRSGIRHIRDGFYNWTNEPFIPEHQALAKAGVYCDYIVPVNPKTTASVIAKFAERVGDMESVEGPNECDAGTNCGGGGANGVKAAVAFMKTVHEAGTMLKLPVIGPSFTTSISYAEAGDISSTVDYNNLHVYFGGRNPGTKGWGDSDTQGHSYGSFEWWEDQAQQDAPGVPALITEAGYISPSVPEPYAVPEGLGASYVPRLLLLAFNKGIKRSYIYELLDEVSSPGYGLLRSDLSEKPAFTALANLVADLSDPGTSFVPATLEYSIKGGDASVSHTLLQKRDGSFTLILWSETSTYDVTKMTQLVDKEQILTTALTGPQQIEEIDHFDNDGNLSRLTVSAKEASIPVDGRITLVKIR